MGLALLSLALLVVMVLMLETVRPRKRRAGIAIDSTAYYAVKPLTKTEQAFYRLLVNSLPGHIVLAQVDIKRIVRTKRGKSHSHFNRIAQLSVDFLVCTPDFSIAAAVELDDPSHEGKQQRARDAKKEDVLKAVNVRLVRFDVRRYPSESAIRQAILGSTNGAGDLKFAA